MPLTRPTLVALALLGLLVSSSAMPMHRGQGRKLGQKHSNVGRGKGQERTDTYIIVGKESSGGHVGKRSTMGECESFLHSSMMNQETGTKTGPAMKKLPKVNNYTSVSIGFIAEMNEAAADMVSKCIILYAQDILRA